MWAENDITLWHFEENGSRVTRVYFPNIHLHFQRAIAKSGIKEKGFHRKANAVVRIPTKEDIIASCGDYLQAGKHTSDMPDYSCAFKVTAICDNRRGKSPHWRLTCGG